MLEKLNIWCIFSGHSEYSRNFWTREEAKKQGYIPRSQRSCHQNVTNGGEGGRISFLLPLHFTSRTSGSKRGWVSIHRQPSQLSHKKLAKCNCPSPFREMLRWGRERGRMPRHHIENPLSIIKAMIAIGRASERAMGVAVRPTSISLCRRFLSLC